MKGFEKNNVLILVPKISCFIHSRVETTHKLTLKCGKFPPFTV